MLERILMAGAGGQGVILCGRLLSQTAMATVANITFFPAYGAEVRGGVSNCQIVLSSDEIPSAVSEVFDSLLFLDPDSVRRFGGARAPGALVLLNASLCQDPLPGAHLIPATSQAEALGSGRAANFVMLGALLARKPLVAIPAMEAAIRRAFAGKGDAVVSLNVRAFHEGLEL